MFINWCRRWTLVGRFIGRFADILLAWCSIHDTHVNLSHAMGWFKQCWCTQVWCKTWWINSLWEGKMNCKHHHQTPMILKPSWSVERTLWIIYAISTRTLQRERKQQKHHHHNQQQTLPHFGRKIDAKYIFELIFEI